MRSLGWGLRLLALGVAMAGATAASAATSIKFTLDWKFQGPTAAFFAAQKLGYFKEAGLDVTIDSGNGSAGAVTRVASGAYQMGFADINALVEFDAAHPDQAAKAVMMVYDAPPFGLYALKKSGIKGPKDLPGKTLGAPVFDASYKLFPAFCAIVGIDPESVKRVNMDPALRETMLVRGDVDFISGHYFSSILDLEAKGVKRDDIVVMLYRDYGMDFYGNAVIASDAFIKQHPDAVRAFNVAVAKGMQYVVANPEKAVDMVAEVDPLIDRKLEVERLNMAIEKNILTPYVKEHGFGDVDAKRLESSLTQLGTALKLASLPKPEDIWTGAFLPPAADRKL